MNLHVLMHQLKDLAVLLSWDILLGMSDVSLCSVIMQSSVQHHSISVLQGSTAPNRVLALIALTLHTCKSSALGLTFCGHLFESIHICTILRVISWCNFYSTY